MVAVHKPVMLESCHHLTSSHAHSHPCLVSLLFIPSLYSNLVFNSKNSLFTCLPSFIPAPFVLKFLQSAKQVDPEYESYGHNYHLQAFAA